jgi:hypothetical protein
MVNRRFAAFVLLLLSGCCYDPPGSCISADAPSNPASADIGGTYQNVDGTGNGSLWQLLTGEMPSVQHKSGLERIRIVESTHRSITVVRLINNVEMNRQRVGIERAEGYIYIHHPRFVTVLLYTSFGCENILIGLNRRGDLEAYRDAAGLVLFTILPIPADPISYTGTFPRVEAPPHEISLSTTFPDTSVSRKSRP